MHGRVCTLSAYSKKIRHVQQILARNQSSIGTSAESREASTAQPQHGQPSSSSSNRKLRDGKTSEIHIHPKIERGPTDILKALASTIGRDYTAAHYRYHDDPYLIPISNLTKRSYALSKEAGRKAARWIRQKHADVFDHRVAQPPVEVFYPTPVFTEETPVDESTLISAINDANITDATLIYGMLQNKGTEISRATKQSLMELVAYYNEADVLDEEWIEERWYRSGMLGKERLKNTWKDMGLAEAIFSELEPADAAAYCAIIRGRAKYFQVEKAWHLYKEAQAKEFSLDIETYNALIRTIYFTRDNSDMRWQLLEELLLDIERAGIQPNLGTLNAILDTLSTIGNVRQGKVLSLETLAEFKQLGIEPCLATYYYILITHCKERGPVSTILVDILREIEGKSFTIQDPKDTFFFVTAMDICRNQLQDLELAQRVNALLHVGNNYDLIGDSYKESVYYRHFVALKCNSETFDVFMQFYDQLVPNIYTPEPQIMEEILKALELNEGYSYLPQLWSDMVIFEHNSRDTLVSKVLQIMVYALQSESVSPTSKLGESFAEIGWKIWEFIETQDPERVKKISWTGQMLGDLMIVCLKAEQVDKAYEILKKLMNSTHEVLGVSSIDSLKLFLEVAIRENNAPLALACIQYVSDAGFAEVIEMADEVFAKVKLDAVQVARLSNIVGFDIRAPKTPTSENGDRKDDASRDNQAVDR